MDSKLMKSVQVVIALGLIGLLVQTGRILERLDRVEEIAADYAQTTMMQGSVTRAEYSELWKIHARKGDLD